MKWLQLWKEGKLSLLCRGCAWGCKYSDMVIWWTTSNQIFHGVGCQYIFVGFYGHLFQFYCLFGQNIPSYARQKPPHQIMTFSRHPFLLKRTTMALRRTKVRQKRGNETENIISIFVPFSQRVAVHRQTYRQAWECCGSTEKLDERMYFVLVLGQRETSVVFSYTWSDAHANIHILTEKLHFECSKNVTFYCRTVCELSKIQHCNTFDLTLFVSKTPDELFC